MNKYFRWNKFVLIGMAVIAALLVATACRGAATGTINPTVAGGGGGGSPLIQPSGQTGASNAIVNTISVTGIGDASGEPDQATIMLGVSATDPDVSKAVGKSNETMQAIMDALKNKGIDAKDIQTANFSVWPEDRFDPQTNQPTGERLFHVDSMVQVTVRDLSKVGDVIDTGLTSGANTVSGLSFSIQDSKGLESEARKEALDNARGKAAEIAEAMTVQLGDAIIVSEQANYPGPVFGFATDKAEGMGGAGAPPISPGQQSVSVTLYVTFAINR